MPETRRFAQGLKRKSVTSRVTRESVSARGSTYSGFESVSILYDFQNIVLLVVNYCVLTWIQVSRA